MPQTTPGTCVRWTVVATVWATQSIDKYGWTNQTKPIMVAVGGVVTTLDIDFFSVTTAV